jgi:hypothetical protein
MTPAPKDSSVVDALDVRKVQHRMAAAPAQHAEKDLSLTKVGPRLKLAIYKPAINRKDVRRRIETALEHFLPYYASGRELTLSVKQLEKHFGFHTKPLYNWMRRNLLVEVRSYSVTAARAITYKVNQTGFKKVWLRLHGHSFEYAAERARQVEPSFRPFIDGAGLPLHRTVEGGRLYGSHQTLEKPVRAVLLKGCYDYDIQAAMPTLVLQSVAMMAGLNWREAFPTWALYLGSRAIFRENLAQRLNITVKQAKEVFQGMFDLRKFDGGRGGISAVIGVEKCKKAMDDAVLTQLRAEAAAAWKMVDLHGRSDGAGRFAYYEQIEQQVMSTIYDIASEHRIRYWPFHDGFTLLDGRRIADRAAFCCVIQERTGMMILIDEDRL